MKEAKMIAKALQFIGVILLSLGLMASISSALEAKNTTRIEKIERVDTVLMADGFTKIAITFKIDTFKASKPKPVKNKKTIEEKKEKDETESFNDSIKKVALVICILFAVPFIWLLSIELVIAIVNFLIKIFKKIFGKSK